MDVLEAEQHFARELGQRSRLHLESTQIPKREHWNPEFREFQRTFDMKSTSRRRTRSRNQTSRQAAYRRELEKVLKQMLAGEIPAGSMAEIRASPRFPYRKVIE